MEFKKKNSF